MEVVRYLANRSRNQFCETNRMRDVKGAGWPTEVVAPITRIFRVIKNLLGGVVRIDSDITNVRLVGVLSVPIDVVFYEIGNQHLLQC